MVGLLSVVISGIYIANCRGTAVGPVVELVGRVVGRTIDSRIICSRTAVGRSRPVQCMYVVVR